MKFLRDFDVRGKRVLARCDFNVPLGENGTIEDDFRIRAALPTIAFLQENGAKVILMSHLGDPGGKVVEGLRLTSVQEKLSELLHMPIAKMQDCIGSEVSKTVFAMAEGDVLLLENVRFHKEEKENEQTFAKSLASLGEIFMNDAFSVCHRNQASVAGIPNFLPSCAGLLLEREIITFEAFLKNPKRPCVAIVGGKKVEDKLSFIEAISGFADAVLVGNLVAKEAQRQHTQLSRPEKIFFAPDGIPNDETAFDIGPRTLALFEEKIRGAQSVFWTGPLGWVEKEEYAAGSLRIVEALQKSGAYTIAGGGDLDSFLGRYQMRDKFSYVSTGGGATLAFLAGKELPGLKALGYYG